MASDHALTLGGNSQLATTQVLADAIAGLYVSFLSSLRREERITIEDYGEPIHATDLVTVGGRRYRALQVETDLEARRQSLVLVEI